MIIECVQKKLCSLAACGYIYLIMSVVHETLRFGTETLDF